MAKPIACPFCVILASMELTLTTPALIFPAISLLFLAYTNRFLTLANLTRELYAHYKTEPDPKICM
jgi:hypothetical protein